MRILFQEALIAVLGHAEPKRYTLAHTHHFVVCMLDALSIPLSDLAKPYLR